MSKTKTAFTVEQIEEIREGLLSMGLWGKMDDSLIPEFEDEDGFPKESEEDYEARIINTLCDMALGEAE